MNKKKLVMIGSGMAGMKAVEEICGIAPDMFDITVFGAERYPNYNRVLLSGMLAGELSIKDITLHDEDWCRERGVALHLGQKVAEIKRGQKKVVTEGEKETAYDNLIIATGASPVILSVPGTEKEGVTAFRSIDDCKRITETAGSCKKAAVIGGGILGLEAARGLAGLGMDVTVVHNQDTLMNLQLDKVAGRMLKEKLEAQGIRFLLSRVTVEIVGNGKVSGVRFSDGEMFECDMVVMAAGIRPNKGLAEASRIYCNKGIVVNDYLQTVTDPAVYAVGECVEHRGKTYGLVVPLFEQARILAHQITGYGIRAYTGSHVSTKLKVAGVNVFSAGEISEDAASDSIEYMDTGAGVYKKLFIKDNTLSGVVMFGDTADGPRFYSMIQSGADISGRRNLLFGDTKLGDTGHSGMDAAAAMGPDTVVCGCNGVTKKTIVDAIMRHGLTTRGEVVKHTKASGSCGGCAPLVEQIIASVTGNASGTASVPLCGCTDFTHEEIKQGIRKNGLTSVMEAFKVLGFKGEGCQVCRPAVNYYIQAIWPAEASDHRQSRVVNERMHANIQKDGTYSVVPRIHGGATTPEELVKIAETARKYNIPLVKLTGGQRIALLGVRKEDLIGVWEELDAPSGYAYGKALRTVKTCVGSLWCRFGTQDSMALGIRLEKMLDRVWTPAKVKLAVSGCPRNCAEASIKDLGVVGIQGGWEIYCGGNGGVKVRSADLLCAVKEEQDVVEVVKAYIQFYREDARHNERTSVWIERVGLKKIREAVLDDTESRKALIKRLDLCLSALGKEPWSERIEARAAGKVEPTVDYMPITL